MKSGKNYFSTNIFERKEFLIKTIISSSYDLILLEYYYTNHCELDIWIPKLAAYYDYKLYVRVCEILFVLFFHQFIFTIIIFVDNWFQYPVNIMICTCKIK